MAFRKYTQCYVHTPGDKPFHIDDLLALGIGTSIPGLIAGIIAAIFGGGLVGVAVGVAIAFFNTIVTVADLWLNHRLVCLSGVRCAIGVVDNHPHDDGLGAFDNDEFFDVRLMPHRPGDEYVEANTGFDQTPPLPGETADGKTEANPANDIYLDGFQGQALIRPLIDDLPYDTTRWTLHCEAEGDFWVRMRDYAAFLAVLVGVFAAAATAAAVAGGAAGAALGCAVGVALFGPIGCIIGAILGAILGAALAGGAVAAAGAGLLYLILLGIYEANKGDVEDANVGDRALGPIRKDDRVIVLGEHVYDGFHEGWHEIHPLMAVMKLGKEDVGGYLEWDPDFAGTPPGDDVPPGLPASVKGLSVDDIKQGLGSEKFRERCERLHDRWCEGIRQAFDPAVITAQARPENRWTIHPSADGCLPADQPEPPH